MLNTVLKNYLQHLKEEKRYSDHTISSYRTDLSQLLDFLCHQYNAERAEEINAAMLRSFLVELVANGFQPKTINRKVSAVRRFVRYLMVQGKIEKDIAEKLSAPRIPKRLPTVVKQKDIMQLESPPVIRDFRSVRDHSIIQLLYQTGIRRSELIGLTIADVDLVQGKIKVLGKGNKERMVPVGRRIADILSSYLEVRRETFGDHRGGNLFLTEKGKPMYPKLVYNIVKRALSAVTSTKKKSPHVLRHTFATHLLDNGADLNAIKEILGHSSLAATQVYTHNSIAKLKDTYQKAHPKGMDRK